MKTEMRMVMALVVLVASYGMAEVKMKGDLRYRYDLTDDASKSDTRQRDRIRARLAAEGSVNDSLSGVIALASGDNGDPISSNQTLGDSWSDKAVTLDKAYLTWLPVDGLHLMGGKMDKPFICVADLIWDTDLNPEGLAAVYNHKVSEAMTVVAHGGYLWLEEVSRSDDDDRKMYSAQLALKGKLDPVSFTLGGGAFSYDNIQGFGTFVSETSGFGNSTATDENDLTSYIHEYELTELFAETKFTAVLPVRLYGQFVSNSDPDEENQGWLAGLDIGEAKEPNDFSVGYNYRDIEKDAVVGAFTDAEVAGGGSNGSGHKIMAAYCISKNFTLNAAQILSSRDPDGADTDYDRTQVDLNCKF